MRLEPVWINRQALLLKHSESLRLFGGAEGLRDEGLFDSALMRPVNVWHYDDSTTHSFLAASYAFGIVKNDPFVDGNKRAAFIACAAFLKLNGDDLTASQPEAYQSMVALAAGALTEDGFAEWLGKNLEPRRKVR